MERGLPFPDAIIIVSSSQKFTPERVSTFLTKYVHMSTIVHRAMVHFQSHQIYIKLCHNVVALPTQTSATL